MLFFHQIKKHHCKKIVKMAGTKTALVLGGTGETGKMVLKELQQIDLISKIIMINRRNVELTGPAVEKVCMFSHILRRATLPKIKINF